jgi:hypothetical protein
MSYAQMHALKSGFGAPATEKGAQGLAEAENKAIERELIVASGTESPGMV